MDNYVQELFNQIHDLCHRIEGYLDAKAALKPNLRFVEDDDDSKVILFPNAKKEVHKKENADVATPDLEQGFINFNQKEIKQMPNHFRKLLIIQKKRCHVRKHVSGRNTTYEIRFRRDGYNVSACGKTIELAKENFIKKLANAKPVEEKAQSTFPTNFQEFTLYYCEKFRKLKITEQTYKNDFVKFRLHIFPTLGKKDLTAITPIDCEQILNKLKAEGKAKTADDVRSLISIILKGAIAHGIIDRNPITIVPHVQHERKHGKALSSEEEILLFQRVHGTPYECLYALALYCGLRPNEIKTARVEGPFIVAVNSKRKNKKVEYKKIPICKKLTPFLEEIDFDLSRLDKRSEYMMSKRFPDFCPGHKLYDLRTTFYTRCKELGVADAARDEFVGHSLGVLGNTYTDLSDKYLLKEGKKLNKW